MSERGSFRGGRGRGGGGGAGEGGGRGGRGGGYQGRGGASGGGAHQGGGQQQQEKPKKENILDLTKYMDKEVNVKFNGGREGMLFYLSCLFHNFRFWDSDIGCIRIYIMLLSP